MKLVEILSVGEEVVSGQITDTNASYLSRELDQAGFSVRFRQSCGDVREEIVSSMALALSRSDFVIVTGGLGPTYDDITRECAAEVFHAKLEMNAKAEEQIRGFFHRRGIPMSENNLLQARVPEGAKVLENLWGTAPGIHLSSPLGEMVLLPGVPREMKQMFSVYVLPYLEEKREGYRKSASYLLHGISESKLDEIFQKGEHFEGVSISTFADPGQIRVPIISFAEREEEAEEKLKLAEKWVKDQVGEFIFGRGGSSLEKELVLALGEKKASIATAESCTGGLVSQKITSVAGASAVFSLGVCTYTEEQKKRMLSVREETLENGGVYSLSCAEEMAEGVCRLSGSDFGIGITGIAGPDGGTEQDPVGTVYIAVATPKETVSDRIVFGTGHTSREEIRSQAASRALFMALSQVKKY